MLEIWRKATLETDGNLEEELKDQATSRSSSNIATKTASYL